MDKVVWFEMPALDTTRAAAFYEKAFDWQTPDMGGGSRMLITTPSNEQGEPNEKGAINGDVSPRTATFAMPTIVVSVKDIEARIESVKAAGGLVIKPAEKLEGMNALFALIADTEMNTIGLLQDL